MSEKAPLVSAIITTYNREAKIVERAISSIEGQTYPNIEIMVIDDNANNSVYSLSLREMCEKHKSVRYIKQNGNQGACAARNLGIMNSRGEYIGCLDDDDIWLNQKVSCQIEKFQDASVGIVFCNGIKRDESTGEESVYNPALKEEVSISFDDMLHADRIGSTSNPLIRRVCFDQVGLFWEKQPARQDYEMWLRITQKYKAVGISDELFVHTIHSGEQISKTKTNSYVGYSNIYKRYKQFYHDDPIAEKYILRNIILNRRGISYRILFYLFKCAINSFKIKYRDR